MAKRIKIPDYAKDCVKTGLEILKNRKKRFTPEESKTMGIYLGKHIGNIICNRKFLEERELRQIALFYNEVKDLVNDQNEEVILIWGGEKFCKLVSEIY